MKRNIPTFEDYEANELAEVASNLQAAIEEIGKDRDIATIKDGKEVVEEAAKRAAECSSNMQWLFDNWL